MTYRSNKGSHVIFPDHFPRNCINCGCPIDYLDEIACPNRELLPKELSTMRKSRIKVSTEDDAKLDDVLKGVFG